MDDHAAGAPEDSEPAAAIGRCANHPFAPAVAPCDRCGLFICTACRDTRAPAGPDDRRLCRACADRLDDRFTMPWEGDRAEGLPRAWWRTVRDLSFKPDRSFRGVGAGDVGRALSFGVVTQSIGLATYLPIQFGFALADPTLTEEVRSVVLVVGVIFVLGLPLWTALGLLFNAAVMHPFLTAVGGQGPLSATLRAMCYASAPVAFYVIPGFGWFLGPALALVSSVYAQRHAHAISGPRVVGAWGLAMLAMLMLVGVVAAAIFLVLAD